VQIFAASCGAVGRLSEECVMKWLKNTITTLKWMELAKFVLDMLVTISSWNLVKQLVSYVPQISPGWASVITWSAAAAVFFLLFRWHDKIFPLQRQTQGSASLLTNVADAGLPAGINIKEFFRTSYRTPAESEVQKNFKLVAQQEEPNDHEAFYLRFLGVGFIAALFDSVWWPMYRSQLLALMEVNRNGGVLPKAQVRAFFEKAQAEYPNEYETDSFERWFSYLTRNGLVLDHPSDMVEITVRGKDFLKYLTHWGREPKDKRL
jgi:hypothetical protein